MISKLPRELKASTKINYVVVFNKINEERRKSRGPHFIQNSLLELRTKLVIYFICANIDNMHAVRAYNKVYRIRKNEFCNGVKIVCK